MNILRIKKEKNRKKQQEKHKKQFKNKTRKT